MSRRRKAALDPVAAPPVARRGTRRQEVPDEEVWTDSPLAVGGPEHSTARRFQNKTEDVPVFRRGVRSLRPMLVATVILEPFSIFNLMKLSGESRVLDGPGSKRCALSCSGAFLFHAARRVRERLATVCSGIVLAQMENKKNTTQRRKSETNLSREAGDDGQREPGGGSVGSVPSGLRGRPQPVLLVQDWAGSVSGPTPSLTPPSPSGSKRSQKVRWVSGARWSAVGSGSLVVLNWFWGRW